MRPRMKPTCRRKRLPRQRLAYDELLANQLALLLIRAQLRGARRARASPATAS